MNKEIDKTEKLGDELARLLEEAGISNLNVETDGSISGNIGLKHFRTLSFEVKDDLITVTGLN